MGASKKSAFWVRHKVVEKKWEEEENKVYVNNVQLLLQMTPCVASASCLEQNNWYVQIKFKFVSLLVAKFYKTTL